MQNNINASKQVKELTNAYSELTAEVSEAVSVFKTYQKTNQKLPSEYLNSLKKLKEVQEQYNKAIATANGKQKEYTATKKEEARLNNATLAAKTKLSQASSKEAQELARLRFETQQQNKATREASVLSSALSTEYQKLVVKMNQASRTVQNLNAKKLQGKKLSDVEQVELKQSSLLFTKYQKAVLGADASVGRFQRNVGNYPKAMGSAIGAVRSLTSALGLMGGAFLFVQVMRDAFKRVREFDKEMQNMAGILRTTRPELKAIENRIIKVASVSIKTSNEVAKLATSLFTLGKSKKEVLDLIEPVNDLSIALGATSEEAGEFLVQTLNAFGAGSDEALEYADTIAAIRTSTSLDFQKMRDSFQYITPISKILNKDLAYTGAVVGVLADNGLKAESAGRLLATAQIKLATSGKSLQQGLDEINDAYKQGKTGIELLTVANGLFGNQAAKIGVILATQQDRLGEYDEKIRSASGSLKDLVDQQLQSLDAKLRITTSAWEEFVLSLDNGNGVVSRVLTGVLDTVNSILKSFTDLNKSNEDKLVEKTNRIYEKRLESLNRIKKQETQRIELIKIEMKTLEKGSDTYNKLQDEVIKYYKTQKSESISLAKIQKSNSEQNISALKVQIYQLQQQDEETKKSGGLVQRWNTTAIEKFQKELAEEQGLLDASNDFIKQNTDLKNENTDALENNADEQLRTVKVLRELIKEQRGLLEGVSTRGEAEIIQKEIKDLQNEIDSILGNNKKSKREKLKSILDLYGLASVEETQEYLDKLAEVLEDYSKDKFGDLLPDEVDLPEIKIPLTQDKIDYYKKNFIFSDDEMDLLRSQFDELGDLYGIDASKFTALFDQKENTVEDYISASAEAFKGLYNGFSDDYEQDLTRVRESYDRALVFAGENTEAQAELRQQLADREREIRIKQAKEEKDKALFNSIINTATGVTSALAKGNIVLSAIIGALGLAKIAKIQSTPLPTFFVGTEDTGIGGSVDGKGGFNAVLHPNERVMTKDQNKKMHGYSNDKVSNIINDFHNKTLFDTELEKMLAFNGIFKQSSNIPNVIVQNNGLTKQDLSEVIGRLENTINGSETSQLIIDETGMNKYIRRGNSRTQVLNRTLRISGKKV